MTAPRIVIIEPGVPILGVFNGVEKFVSVADWIDEHGIQRHSKIVIEDVVYTTPRGAASPDLLVPIRATAPAPKRVRVGTLRSTPTRQQERLTP